MPVISWFEIPVTDIERAKKFYNIILDIELTPYDSGESPMSMIMFPEMAGALVQSEEGYAPSAEGTTVYLYTEEDLNIPLGKVEEAGGKILMPKTDIGEHGFTAWIQDTEGNRVGLHSMK